MVQSRVTASLIHLAISAVLLSVLSVVVFFIWYPDAYFGLAGAIRPMQALVMVDLVIGPLLTLIVYKVGKPSLKFDLAVIALLQISALIYGTWALAQQRPAFLVYEGGVFHVISAVDVNEEKVPEQINALRGLVGVTQVWAKPFDSSERLLGVLMDGNADIYLLPEQYRPFDLGEQDLKAHGTPVTEQLLKENPDIQRGLIQSGENIDTLLSDSQHAMRLYPVLGRTAEGIALVNVEARTVESIFAGLIDVARYRADISLPAPSAQPAIEQE